MSKMKTNEFYIQELQDKNPDMLPLEEYRGGTTKILHRHKICGYEWKVTPKSLLKGNKGCPKCGGRLCKESDIFVQEVHQKHGDDYEVLGKYINSRTKITVRHKCGHTFETLPSNLLFAKNGKGCPKCSHRHFYKPGGSLADNYPDFCKLLVNKDDGYRQGRYTEERLELKCPECGHIQKRQPNSVITHGFSCEICRDGLSKNEKIMRSVLSQLNVNFEVEKTFEWSAKKRYDFYFDGIICEMHGAQHYEEGFVINGNPRTFKDEVANDKFKKQIAFENGFNEDTYIVINCRDSNFEWVKTNILSSKLSKHYDLSIIDWKKCEKDSITSAAIVANNLWESGMSTSEIAKKLKLSQCTIANYLGSLSNVGVSSYDPHLSKISGLIKRVVCLNTLEVFNSITEASIVYNINDSSISECCSKHRKSAGTLNGNKLVWRYYEEYIKLSDMEIKDILENNNLYGKKVICLNNKKIFKNISEATAYYNLKSKSSISSCCRGVNQTAGKDKASGEKLKWMYYKDYLESIAS